MALQNHIHLALTVAEDGEKAPIYQWKISDRLDIPEVFLDSDRSLTGKLQVGALANGSGVVQLTDWRYVIIVRDGYGYTIEQRIDQLKTLHGKQAYLCDVYHAADDADHTADIQNVWVMKVGEFAPEGTDLPFYKVEVQLKDNSL